MKKFVRRSIFTFFFALACVICGAVSVKAAEAALNNTKLSGYDVSYRAEENDYYAISRGEESRGIKLTSKNAGQFKGLTMKYYSAFVSVVKCTTYDADAQACSTWSKYDYSSSETATMDALKQYKGQELILDFDPSKLVEAKGIMHVNGATLGELDSVYSLADTYFVIVQYTLQRWPLADIVYDPDIFRVVVLDEVADIQFSQKEVDGKVKVTITSGVPINTVRYFYSTSAQAEGFDYETAYVTSTNGVVVLAESEPDPYVKNGLFSYSFEITVTEGQYYYVEATDVGGRVSVYNVVEKTINQGDTQKPIAETAGDTDVGKIILISLVVVFVLAVVLVIVQKIIDYRKKLY